MWFLPSRVIVLIMSICLILGFTLAIAGDDEDEEKQGTVKVSHNVSEFPAMAKINYLQAAEIALKDMQGGILEIELENEDGFLVYGIEVAGDDKVVEYVIDAGTGEILGTEVEHECEGCENCEGCEKEGSSMKEGTIRISHKAWELPGMAKIDYKKAIEAAKKKTGGEFLSLKLVDDEGFLIYEIVIIDKDNSIVEVEIDAGSGEIVEIEKAESENREED